MELCNLSLKHREESVYELRITNSLNDRDHAEQEIASPAPLAAGTGQSVWLSLRLKTFVFGKKLLRSVLEYTAGIFLLILLRNSNNPPLFLLTKVITGAEWCLFFPFLFFFFFLSTAFNPAAATKTHL